MFGQVNCVLVIIVNWDGSLLKPQFIFTNPFSLKDSFTALVATMNSTSVVNNATTDC